jgi:hypothetical protein
VSDLLISVRGRRSGEEESVLKRKARGETGINPEMDEDDSNPREVKRE